MQRINRIADDEVSPESAELLEQVRQQMGGVPNILATMARSPATLGAFLGFSGALAGGRLSSALREQIALAVAGTNQCDYCASVHTALAQKLGVPRDERTHNLQGRSSDPSTHAALTFSTRIVDTAGHVSGQDLDAVREAGFSDEEVLEIIGNTVLNIFTNYFNHIAGTEIDFPFVPASVVAA